MKTPQISHSAKEIPNTQSHSDFQRLDMILCHRDENHILRAVLYQLFKQEKMSVLEIYVFAVHGGWGGGCLVGRFLALKF